MPGTPSRTDAFARGLAMRRRVMGDAFVDAAFDGASDFTRPLQEFITSVAWGGPWCRGGLDARTRSLVTVAMLAALGRGHELAGHVRGALNNGVTEEELRELLLHAAIYCGVPLAAEAFRAADEVIAAQRSEEEG